ncbi:DUF2141 domain-containing protein [Govanella unica]|uniref:DUF2141 domain-containing protein n=1 Tax=Govanella unica TaxID=2975056 RepID=A0A9X3TXT0_9PROT|nr:DUF2141 domain-containing protein [Govania unica]MDA5193647.1 DUF2141 domain-containing protein [Govania unica]
MMPTAAYATNVGHDSAQGLIGTSPDECQKLSGRPDLLVRATQLKNLKGTVRFVLYGDNPKDFLKKGKRLARVEIPAKEGAMVCISLPKPGNYAIAVLHDINANGKFNLASDGGGFSNNPKIMFSRPSYDETSFAVGDAGIMLDIRMRYLSGGK